MKGSICPGSRQIPADDFSRTCEPSLGTPVTEASPELSIVVPVFNEGANVEALIARLRPVLDRALPLAAAAEAHALLADRTTFGNVVLTP